MNEQIAQLNREVERLNSRTQYLEGLIGTLFYSDRFIIGKTMQFNDGRNIQTGKSTGTKIGTEATQKIGFFGQTPIVQVGAISAPNAQGGTYSQTDANTLKTAIDAIRTALTNLGLTA
jgi:hypothetical protein